MQDFYEIFSGSTVDVSFIKQHLEDNSISCIVKNKHDESITENWHDIKKIVGSKIMVATKDFEKADELVKNYFSSREIK